MATDLIKKVIDEAYAKGAVSRRRVQIEMDKYREFTYIRLTVGEKVVVRRFHRGMEVMTRWMIQHDRLPWIAKMLKEGFSQKRIAEMLCFSTSTINKDVRFMRENKPDMLDEAHLIPNWRPNLAMRNYEVPAGTTIQ